MISTEWSLTHLFLLYNIDTNVIYSIESHLLPICLTYECELFIESLTRIYSDSQYFHLFTTINVSTSHISISVNLASKCNL